MRIVEVAAPFLALVSLTASGNELLHVSNGSSNPFATAMDMMTDAMDRYSKKRAWEDTLGGSAWQMQPWSWAAGGMPGMSPQMPGMASQVPGQGQMQQMMEGLPEATRSMRGMTGQMAPAERVEGGRQAAGAFAPMVSPQRTNAPTQSLDGAWQGGSGEVLLVRNGLFRLYADRERYHDGRIAVRGGLAVMAGPDSGQSRSYEYAVHQGRLVLRDAQGNLLLYRKLPDSAIRALLANP